MRHLTSLVVAAIVTQSLAAQTPRPDRAAIARQVDSLLVNYLADGRGASAAVAVVRGRDTIVMTATGLADVDGKRPASATTIYRIGSLTKQFTAALILQLAEQGKLSLDDSLGGFLPATPAAWRGIPIRRLLNHTSGVHNYTDVASWRQTWSRDLKASEIIAFVENDTLDFKPGTRWSYSNTGYVLLGMIIEAVTRQRYARVVQDRIFKPLGMTRSSYCASTPPPREDFALGYNAGVNGLTRAPYLSLTHPHAAGALCMTAGDFVRWQQALAGGRVVSAASYREMTTPEVLGGGARNSYGFGIGVVQVESHRGLGHGGGIHGFVTNAAWFPDDSVQVVVFSNSAVPAFGRLTQTVQRAALGVPLGLAAIPLPAADRDRFVGTYDLQLPNRVLPFRIFVRDGALMSQAEGQGEIPLRYLGNKVFGADFDTALRVTFVEENGAITKLTLLQGGGLFDGPRRP